ncbi:glycerol-3-phosphate 1-O-acyltransferase PlsY [Spiroplasma endosymbiont of Virgichneumon dumeticola]|uniref:glycerol-3-phosphate 1-O-acyltransferase PlsY n=1 Tax=Spiroplasma endosymbiont of Virgichneumon dumeticola TaxID=3139323 RepID=UPI0035C8C44B
MPHINLLGTFIFIIIGYLIGSISPAIIISKIKFKTDVRNHFSKNAGATNSTRVMGAKWGAVILIIDGFKPAIAIMFAYVLTLINITDPNFHNMFNEGYLYATGLAAVIGHCWPIFYGFRGGKGAAASLGVLLMINPIYCVLTIAIWWFILYLSRMSSLSSILMIVPAFILSWIPHMPLHAWLWQHDTQYYFVNIIIGLTWLLVVTKHWTNVKRIFNGTERKVKLFDRKKDKIVEPVVAEK